MPFVKLEYIYKIIEEKELPYFKVTDGKTLIGKNNDESEPAKAVELLRDIIDMIEDSVISISLSEKNDKEKSRGGSNWDNYNFKVRLKQADSINGTGGINGTILSLMEKNNELMRTIGEQQKNQVIEGLQRQITELKEDKAKPDVLEKYAPLLFQALSGKPAPAALAGINDGPVNEAAVDKKEQIRAAVIRLSRIDSNLHDTLTRLADFAEAHPDKYKSFIPLIPS